MRITLSLVFMVAIAFASCKKDTTEVPENTSSNPDCDLPVISNTSNIKGYGILEKTPGIWNGPLFSPTPLGSFPEWIVDFRPISPSQVSAKNELDSINDIFMSFFIVKHDCEYKIAFRNGGGFAGSVRNSYLIIDSLNENESESFYRFADPILGETRVQADLTFKEDSLIMHVYTNQFNTLPEPTTHMIWTASLRDETATQEAISLFNFPQKQVTKDFSTTFNSLSEAVFYSTASDPYPEEEQPHLGNSNINVSITNPSIIDPSKKILYIITTEPLFSGFTFIQENLDFRSRYVLSDAQISSNFNFNYMHPGDYFLNAIYDSNGDENFSSGDYMNSSFDIPFTLEANGVSTPGVTINFQIP